MALDSRIPTKQSKPSLEKLPQNATLTQCIEGIQNVVAKTTTLANSLKNNLIDKGVEVLPTDKMDDMVEKVNDIPLGKKWASGETISTSENPNRVIFRGLDFKPSFAIAYRKDSNGWYKVGKMINMNGISSAFYNWHLPSGSGNQTIHTYDISSVLFEDGCSMPVPSGNELYYWIAYE